MLTSQHLALVRWLSRLSALVYYGVLSVVLCTSGHWRIYKASFALSIFTTVVTCIWLLLDFAVIVIVKYKQAEKCNYLLEHISQTPKPVICTNTTNAPFNSINTTNITNRICSDNTKNCQTETFANHSSFQKEKELDVNTEQNAQKTNKVNVNSATCTNVSVSNDDKVNNIANNGDIDAIKHNNNNNCSEEELELSLTQNSSKNDLKETVATVAHSGDSVHPFTFVQNEFACSTNSLPFTVPSDSKANSQTDGITENVAFFPARTQVFYNCYQQEQEEQKRRQQLLIETSLCEKEHAEIKYEPNTINGCAENTVAKNEENKVFDMIGNINECKANEFDNVNTSKSDIIDGADVNNCKVVMNTLPTVNMNTDVIEKEECNQHALKELTSVFDEQSELHAENSPKMELLDLIAGSSNYPECVTNDLDCTRVDVGNSIANMEHTKTQEAGDASNTDQVEQNVTAKLNFNEGNYCEKVNQLVNENEKHIKLTQNPLIPSSSSLLATTPPVDSYNNKENCDYWKDNNNDNNNNIHRLSTENKHEEIITQTLIIRTVILYILLILSLLFWASAFYISYDTCSISTALAAFFVQPLWANFIPLQAVYLQARKELYRIHCKAHNNKSNNNINNNINQWEICNDNCHLQENLKLHDLSYLARVESFLNFHDKMLQIVLNGYTTSIVFIISLCVYIAAVVVLSTAQWSATSLYVPEYTYYQTSPSFALLNSHVVKSLNHTVHLNNEAGVEAVLSYHPRSKELFIISSLSPVCLFFAMSLAVLTLVTSSYEVLYRNAQRIPESIMSRSITTAESAYEEPWQTPRQSEIAIRSKLPLSLTGRPWQSFQSQNTQMPNVAATTREGIHDAQNDKTKLKVNASMPSELQTKQKEANNVNNYRESISPEQAHHITDPNDLKRNQLTASDPDHHFTLNNVSLIAGDNVTLSEDALSSMTLDDRYSSVSSVVRQSFSIHAMESFPEVAHEHKRNNTILPIRGSILSNSKELNANTHNAVMLSTNGNAPRMDKCNRLSSNELTISPLLKYNLAKRSSEQESMLHDYSVMTSFIEAKHGDFAELKSANSHIASFTPSTSPYPTLPTSSVKLSLPLPLPPPPSSPSPFPSLVQTRNLTILYLAYRPVKVVPSNNTLSNVATELSSTTEHATGGNIARVHNTAAATSHINQKNKNNSNSTIAMHTSEHNAFAGFDALLRALYVIERRLSDENDNDVNNNNNNKNARKRSNKPSRRLFSLRSENKVNPERITYTLTAYEDALCLIWGIQPFASDPILLALQMATEFVNYFNSVNLNNISNNNNHAFQSYRLVAAIVHSPQTVLACLEQPSSLSNAAAIYNSINASTGVSSNSSSGAGLGIVHNSSNSNSSMINLSVDTSLLGSSFMHSTRNKNSKVICLTRSIHFFNVHQHAIGAQLLERGFTIYAERLSEELACNSQEKQATLQPLLVSSQENTSSATCNPNTTTADNRKSNNVTSVESCSSSFHGILLDSRAAHNAAQLVLCRPCGLVCCPTTNKLEFSWEGGMEDYLHTFSSALGVNNSFSNNIYSRGAMSNQMSCAVCYDFINYIPYKEDEEWHLMLARKAELGKSFMSLTEAEQQIQQNNLDAAIAILQTTLLPYTTSLDVLDAIANEKVDNSANALDTETVMMTKLLLHQVQAFRDARQKLDEME